ncbi:hypothetical protein NIES4071_100820 (plasmid) [Calothrix sp. NIES-4071]|nr:hypothetical protein NIES4071_100820 [Calothrix sp. NIES-4071]BAZ64463.1 hypothetical protein NIES4105_101960 [Calothrix sp. NIES-4105]
MMVHVAQEAQGTGRTSYLCRITNQLRYNLVCRWILQLVEECKVYTAPNASSAHTFILIYILSVFTNSFRHVSTQY